MRLELDYNGVVRVTLSRRNLLTLVAELDQPDAARVIVMRGAYLEGRLLEDIVLAVVAELDDAHYADRGPPGQMAAETEIALESAAGSKPPLGASQERERSSSDWDASSRKASS